MRGAMKPRDLSSIDKVAVDYIQERFLATCPGASRKGKSAGHSARNNTDRGAGVCGVEHKALREFIHQNTNIAQSRPALTWITVNEEQKSVRAEERCRRSIQGDDDVHKRQKFSRAF